MTPSDAFVPLPIGHADIKLALKKSKSPLLTPVALDARDLTQILARYRAPSCRRSIVELVITAGPLILLWLLMWATLDLGSRLIKSTIQEQRRGRQRPGNFAPAYRSGLRCA